MGDWQKTKRGVFYTPLLNLANINSEAGQALLPQSFRGELPGEGLPPLFDTLYKKYRRIAVDTVNISYT